MFNNNIYAILKSNYYANMYFMMYMICISYIVFQYYIISLPFTRPYRLFHSGICHFVCVSR